MGETLAGLGFEKGVELAEKLRWIVDVRGNMTRAALRWILDYDEVTCVIPGFRNVNQVEDNLAAQDVPRSRKRLRDICHAEVHKSMRGAY